MCARETSGERRERAPRSIIIIITGATVATATAGRSSRLAWAEGSALVMRSAEESMAPSAIGSEEASFAIPRIAKGVTAAVGGRVDVEAARSGR